MNVRVMAAADDMGRLIAPLLKDGLSCRLVCGGNSMAPLIQSGDTLTLAPLGKRHITVGDVLAYRHPRSSHLVIHRVVELRNHHAVMKGDHAREPDACIQRKDVLGILETVTRNDRQVMAGLGSGRRYMARFSRMGLTRLCSSVFATMKRRIRLFCR